MEKFLRPERFDATPNASGSDKVWVHWKRTFTSFLTSVSASHHDIDKFEVLINFVSPAVFEYISDCNNYDNAMQTLEALFVSPKNEIFARHILATRLQQLGETLVEYINVLKLLAKDCQFKPVTAEIYRQELIRDAFINGIQSQHIQQRLLVNITLTLEAALDQETILKDIPEELQWLLNGIITSKNPKNEVNERSVFIRCMNPGNCLIFCAV